MTYMSQRIVAFVDVLGFRTLVNNVSQPQLVEIYRDLQATARLQTTSPVFPDDQRRFDSDAYYEDSEISRKRVVNVVMASDSIVVYSATVEYADALAVAAAVRGLLVAGFRNGVALRGALAIGELDEVRLDDDALDGGSWTARFSGLVGLGLVRAYDLEGSCNWSGAVLHPDLVAHLDKTVLAEHEDGPLTALDIVSANLALQTQAPTKTRRPDGETEIKREQVWAINWPFVTDAPEWEISEEQVSNAFTSFGRTELTSDVEAKRDETIAFMRRASKDLESTRSRLSAQRRSVSS